VAICKTLNVYNFIGMSEPRNSSLPKLSQKRVQTTEALPSKYRRLPGHIQRIRQALEGQHQSEYLKEYEHRDQNHQKMVHLYAKNQKVPQYLEDQLKHLQQPKSMERRVGKVSHQKRMQNCTI
jgi:uncharacterized protein YukE